MTGGQPPDDGRADHSAREANAFHLPQLLVDAANEQGRAAWLTELPRIISSLCKRWDLVCGPPFQPGGTRAYVAPARRGDVDGDVVLKVLWPHVEAEHEFDALAFWAGDGAVLVHAKAAGDHFRAAVLERCRPGLPLKTLPEPEQDVVVAGLLKRLWRDVPPGSGFRPLRAMCEEWAEEYEERDAATKACLDPGLAREGIALFRHLAEEAPLELLLATDLHADNVLSAEREPWLVVDPKPHVGDPHYDVLQHMLKCPVRLRADPVVLSAGWRPLTGLDAARVRAWLLARCVVDSPFSPGLGGVARTLAAEEGRAVW